MLITTRSLRTPTDFETIYTDAEGDPTRIPWADLRPHPALVAWLNVIAPSIVRCGARVAVVGCGLGDDAAELARRGYDVTAFDCSPTAVEWAEQRFSDSAVSFHVADLFELPRRWHHRFDLVVEVNTIQSLPPPRRGETVLAISDLLSPHGLLLVICRGTQTPVTDGPPWALTEAELLGAAHAGALVPERELCTFHDAENPQVLRTRAVFKRAGC